MTYRPTKKLTGAAIDRNTRALSNVRKESAREHLFHLLNNLSHSLSPSALHALRPHRRFHRQLPPFLLKNTLTKSSLCTREICRIFKFVDVDGSNTITVDELLHVLELMGVDAELPTVSKLTQV